MKNLLGWLSYRLKPEQLRQALKSDFIQKVIETLATRVLVILIGLITTVIVARTLGPAGRGLYAVAATVGAIGVQFGNLGLHASNTYYVARNRQLLPTLLGNSLIVSLVLGSFGAIITWLIFTMFPKIAPVHGLLLILALLWIPLGLAYLLLQNLLLGIQKVRAYNTVELVNKIISVILIGGLIITKLVSVETVFSTGLIALIVGCIWIMWQLTKEIDQPFTPSLSLFKENIRYGIKAYLAAFFAFMVLRVDLLMVKYILGPEQVGYYSIAVSMADLIYMLPVVVGTILFPRLSVLIEPVEKWKLTQKTISAITIIMIVLAISASLLATPMVRLLFGQEFLPAVPAFILLMPAIVFLSVNTICMNFFAAINMPMIVIYSPVLAFTINIILNWIMLPWVGLSGASISSIISYGVMMVLSLRYIKLHKVRVLI